MFSLRGLIVTSCLIAVGLAIPRPPPNYNETEIEQKFLVKPVQSRATFKTKWVTHDGRITDSNYGNSIQIDATSSVSARAHTLAATIIAHMTRHMSAANFGRAATNTKIGVFREAETLAVYPEYYKYATYGQCSAHQCSGTCHSTCTFDNNRQYYTLAGAGGPRAVIREENLLCHDDYRGQSNILVHEYSHSIHGNVLDSGMKSRIMSAFANARNTGIWVGDSYAMSNEEEYFAVGVTAFFDADETPQGAGHMNQCGSSVCTSEASSRYYLYQKDITLYGIIYDIFTDKPGQLRPCMA